MLLRELQSLLAASYRLDIDAEIADFLITDRATTHALLGRQCLSCDEMLLVREASDSLDLSLFLDADMLKRLDAADPLDTLDAQNLEDFSRVLEGVSHFVYLVWNACNSRSVTRLELEMQAEIDKYLSARLLLDSQPEGALAAGELPARLFAGVRYHEHLEQHEIERYRRANDLAHRFCTRLQERHPGKRVSVSMLHELRAFYRMPQPDKLSHINSAQFA